MVARVKQTVTTTYRSQPSGTNLLNSWKSAYNPGFKKAVPDKILLVKTKGKHAKATTTAVKVLSMKEPRQVTVHIKKGDVTISHYVEQFLGILCDFAGKPLHGASTQIFLSAFKDELLPDVPQPAPPSTTDPQKETKSAIEKQMHARQKEQGVDTTFRAEDDADALDPWESTELTLADSMRFGLLGGPKSLEKFSSGPKLPGRKKPAISTAGKENGSNRRPEPDDSNNRKKLKKGKVSAVKVPPVKKPADGFALQTSRTSFSNGSTLSTFKITNTLLAKYVDEFETAKVAQALQRQAGAMVGRTLAVVWTDDKLSKPYVADCTVNRYNMGTKIALVKYEDVTDLWEGDMRLDKQFLNGGSSKGALLGKSQMHCRPFAVYKQNGQCKGTSLSAALEQQQRGAAR